MTDVQFHKSFNFFLFNKTKSYSTDHMLPTGSPQHYVARLICGKAEIATAKGTLKLSAGDIFYIPKGLKYRSYWYTEGGRVDFYSFGFDLFPSSENAHYRLQKIDCNEKSRALLDALESDLTVTPHSIGLLYEFLGSVQDSLATEEKASGRTTVSRAVEYMRQSDEYSVSDIADFCSVSETGLYLMFKKQLGKTPIEVKHELLCEKATELLCATDLSVEQISEKLGFSSSSYFRKVFIKQTSLTPTEIRKQYRTI